MKNSKLFSEDTLFAILAMLYVGFLYGVHIRSFIDSENQNELVLIAAISQTGTLWPATEWVYGPLWPYLIYFYSKIFPSDILSIRYLVTIFIVLSSLGIYRIGRLFCTPIFSFGLVIFTHLYFEWPTGQMTKYIMFSFSVWGVYFCFRYVYSNHWKHLSYGGIFLGFALITNGYPFVFAIAGIIPFYLLIDGFVISRTGTATVINRLSMYFCSTAFVVVSAVGVLFVLENNSFEEIWTYFLFPFHRPIRHYYFPVDSASANSFIQLLGFAIQRFIELITGYHKNLLLLLALTIILSLKQLDRLKIRGLVFVILLNAAYIPRMPPPHLNHTYLPYAVLFVFLVTNLAPLAIHAIIQNLFKWKHFKQIECGIKEFRSKILESIVTKRFFLSHYLKDVKKRHLGYLAGMVFISYTINVHAQSSAKYLFSSWTRGELVRATIYPFNGIYVRRDFLAGYRKVIKEIRENYPPGSKFAFLYNADIVGFIPFMEEFRKGGYLTDRSQSQMLTFLSPLGEGYDHLMNWRYGNNEAEVVNNYYKNQRLKVLNHIKRSETDVLIMSGQSEKFEIITPDKKGTDKSVKNPRLDRYPLRDYLLSNFVLRKVLTLPTDKKLGYYVVFILDRQRDSQ